MKAPTSTLILSIWLIVKSISFLQLIPMQSTCHLVLTLLHREFRHIRFAFRVASWFMILRWWIIILIPRPTYFYTKDIYTLSSL